MGVKLWREYNTFLDYQTFRCCDCAAVNQDKDITNMDAGGMSSDPSHRHPMRSDAIGWLIPAVPTEEGDTFWGYTSVPQPGCDWWTALPLRLNRDGGES